MSKRKDRERAKKSLYRGGQKIDRAVWDKHQRELRELAVVQRLKVLGLTTARPSIAVAQRAGLEQAAKRIMTPEEVWGQRR